MQHGKVHGLRASVAALTLGGWVAACSSTEAQQNEAPATAAGTAASSVGAGGAAASSNLTGGTPTAAGDGTAAVGPSAAGSVTGAAVTGTTGGTDTTGSRSSMGAVGATGSAGVTGSAGAASTAAVATTGSMPDEASCATRPALVLPGIVDFESYDGATQALEWQFVFNDDGSGMSVLYGGFFDNSDGSGMASLQMVGGDTSTWAVRATNTEASVWGGGIGLWLGCMDASSYTGISLAVRGSTPDANSVSVAITADGLAAGVGTTISVTDLFTTFELPFTEFTNEYEETTNGDNINGLAINAQMLWVQDEATEEWSVAPGAYEVVVDDITFH